MTSQLHNAKLGLMLPAILNPATAAVVGIGLGLLWLLRDDEREAAVDDVPTKRPKMIAQAVVEPSPAVEQNSDVREFIENEAAHARIPDLDQKEIIRSAMSELGKRSAAARAKKKAERQELR
jgi:hypothetical protein